MYDIRVSTYRINHLDRWSYICIIMSTPSPRIVLIAPGFTPFPPTGWGAVESIVWDYYENLRARHIDVHIVNESDPPRIIHETNALAPTLVHIMYDDYIVVVPQLECRVIYYTSHYAYLTHPQFEQAHRGYFQRIFQVVLAVQDRVVIHAISEDIRQLYIRYGFPPERVRVVRNGAREDRFRFTMSPTKFDRSVYLAKVEYRKAQYKYQTIPEIDFVGNYQDSPFRRDHPHYLGEWQRETLYHDMTEYGNLVLLSEGEADPLVVKEALMAGLGVVVSECSAANLDRDRPFITVIPNDRLHDQAYVREAIKLNRTISSLQRGAIRRYALDQFAWTRVIDEYMDHVVVDL